jgi:LacI family transcriptional regulator
MERALRESGYYLMLRAVAGAEDLTSFLHNWSVDGLFLTGLFEDDEIFGVISALEIPVVLADSYLADYGKMAHVGLQDFMGGFIATEYLLQSGHRRVAFACPPIRPKGVVEQRLAGYREALASYGVAFDESLVFEREFSTKGTMELGESLGKLEGLTAVFATADIMASGIMSGLQQSGKKVPVDISVVGFDDIDWCRMTMPMLTTVRQDANRRGRIAARLMVELLEGRQPDERNIILPVSLQIRDSVRKI